MSRYAKSQWNSICDVCGLQYKSSKLKKRWDGLMVCNKDFEPRHPSDSFRAKADNQRIPWSKPDGSMTQTGTDINNNSFPPAENTGATDHGIEPSEGTFNITSPIT